MKYYLFNSKILTHVLFWIVYYLFFGFVWTRNGNYYEAYFLEFILLPIRIMAVYMMIYALIPKFLERDLYSRFGIAYVVLLLICGMLQSIFTYLYKGFLGSEQESIFSVGAIFRNIILINSTVIFIVSFKIFSLWKHERAENKTNKTKRESKVFEIKADKRTYRVKPSEILYLESLGNYVTYFLKDRKLISYTTLSDCASKLPENFIRIHKSYIVNKEHITSYNNEDIEVGTNLLPIGRTYKSDLPNRAV